VCPDLIDSPVSGIDAKQTVRLESPVHRSSAEKVSRNDRVSQVFFSDGLNCVIGGRGTC
jgi:hypothetical protein